jgi:hypothetical protein
LQLTNLAFHNKKKNLNLPLTNLAIDIDYMDKDSRNTMEDLAWPQLAAVLE